MNRLWLGLGILVVALAVGLGVTWGLGQVQEPISRDLSQAAVCARQENWPQAVALADQARERWERHWHFGASVTDHEPMEEIDALFAELEVWQERRDPEEFGSRCARLSRLTMAIADAHRFRWWNLL